MILPTTGIDDCTESRFFVNAAVFESKPVSKMLTRTDVELFFARNALTFVNNLLNSDQSIGGLDINHHCFAVYGSYENLHITA